MLANVLTIHRSDPLFPFYSACQSHVFFDLLTIRTHCHFALTSETQIRLPNSPQTPMECSGRGRLLVKPTSMLDILPPQIDGLRVVKISLWELRVRSISWAIQYDVWDLRCAKHIFIAPRARWNSQLEEQLADELTWSGAA